MSTARALADAWRQARDVVVLTGAGLSTASGIPDFRSPGGRWERYQPVPLPEFLASERAREAYWRYKGETWHLICAAEPNAAHLALADLARAGRVALLVTQNVDGLHERSGFPPERLVNIHGTDSAVECMACHRRAPRALAQAAEARLARAQHPRARGVLRQHLGDEEDLLAPPRDRLADQLLDPAGAVHLGRIDVGHAQVEPGAERSHRRGTAVALHVPRPLANDGHGDARRAERLASHRSRSRTAGSTRSTGAAMRTSAAAS